MSMTAERLEDLVIISAEKDRADAIDLEDLVEKFKLSHTRKLPL